MEKKNIFLILAAVAAACVLLGIMCSLFGMLVKWTMILLAVAGIVWLTGYIVFDINLYDYAAGILRPLKKEKGEDNSSRNGSGNAQND